MFSSSFAPLAQAFGLTVAHSLWQITLIWVVFKLLEWWLHPRHQAVYLLSLAAMLASVVSAVATFIHAWARLQLLETTLLIRENEGISGASDLVSAPATLSLSLWEWTQKWVETNAALIGWAWLICAGLLWMRLIGGWWLAQRLRQRNVSNAGDAFQRLCNDWVKRLKINPNVRLLESSNIAEPLTLGFWKPVVLFPVGMLLQLTPAQVEALLLHELAHIRRHDYLVNLFQLALEVCFFYHPLFWLLSREARSRREFCCDELVLRHTSDPLLYAKTLTDLQLSFLHPSTSFVMNATGKSRFTERILHIVGITPKRSARPNFLVALLLPLAIGFSSWSPTMPEPTLNKALDMTANPTPKLDGKYSSGAINAETMQQTKGIFLGLKNVDLDANCAVVGFEATYLPTEEDPISRQNSGGEWNSSVLEWIKKAKPGDTFYFDDILIKCPGDAAPRNVGGLVFKIKAE